MLKVIFFKELGERPFLFTYKITYFLTLSENFAHLQFALIKFFFALVSHCVFFSWNQRAFFTLQVPVQRVTKYPLLLSRLLKVTPAHHEDRSALQESRERIEHHLENMNQEARDTNSTRLWRRISMINVSSYRKMDSQLDVLGNTTWGIRKVLYVLLHIFIFCMQYNKFVIF